MVLKREIKIFFTALMFYTRIPVPKSTGFSEDNLNRATKYFPLIGIIVGSAGAFIYLIAAIILPLHLSVLFSLATTILLTGAFHEDGFADFCDGLGGYSQEQILEIMKDSRIGTYGAIGLLMMFLSRFFSLSAINPLQIPVVIIAAHAFSRMLPVILIYTSQYVGKSSISKSKPVGQKGSGQDVLIAFIFAVMPLALIQWQASLLIIPVSVILLYRFNAFVVKQIGGYTGDVLGALQQLAELAFYICFIVTTQ
jgi:adenosylcobinamide-GDP ribazoletransferase